ncbi:SDR family oxidoreductase [Novosphingobium terrae]|uniref:SDR family oxidoreductase n=1 Tax=Novosphingobium terrae TaxID=2726189 RepID=UPI00197F3FB8|nr:SDR family oxidoreductase [Novosphingobium terrae]
MSDTTIGMIHEDTLPGHETRLEPKPAWQPRHPGSGKLAGKVAVITGGDSGIGRAVAALFAREGADIAIAYLNEHDDARETEKIVIAEGQRVLSFAGDLGEKANAERFIAQVIATFGTIDIVVSNAGEQHEDQNIEDITEDQLRRTFQTNVFAMFFLVQAAMPYLKKGASIVTCTSVTMYQGSPGLLDYASTKGAITAFTRSLSENLIEKGIRVNAVAPGPIWTPLNPMGGANPEKVAHFGEDTPMGRPGQPNEVAPSFLFLASDDASYMSGQVLHPNGGTIVGS